MRIEESPLQADLIISRMREQMDGGFREPGLHVSDLVMCLRKSWLMRQLDYDSKTFPSPQSMAEGSSTSTDLEKSTENLSEGLPGSWTSMLEPKSSLPIVTEDSRRISILSERQSPSTTLLFATGRAIQDYITASPADVSEVKLVKDGIHGTADHVDPSGTPWEIKATYASAAKDVLDTPHYFDQLAAYCVMIGIDVGILVVFYINGYYDFMRKQKRVGAIPGERSVLKAFPVEFSDTELTQHWRRLTRRAEILTNAEKVGDIPLEMHYTWECGYCPFQGVECPGGKGLYENHWKG